MKTNSLVLAALASLACAAPSFADGGLLSTTSSFLGTTTALVVDVPEGMVVDSGFKCPVKFTHSLAGAFGDENGWTQNVVGALIGVPTGMVFGLPYGAIVGGRHAMTVGWDKPFSAESFVVSNEEK